MAQEGAAMGAWVWLTVTIICEAAGTAALKSSYGLTKILPTALTLFFYCISFIANAFTLKALDLGYAYAIRTGLGFAIIAMISVTYFGENMNGGKLVSIFLIVSGIIGLQLFGNE